MDRRPIPSDSAAALTRANQLRSEIAGGTPFAEVARRESSDTISGRQGGDLGTWRKGAFDSDFEKAAWSLPLNTVSQPVLTQFGYHLVEITKRWPDSATGRHILVPIEVVGEHRDELDARADSLETLAAERLDPAALDTAARALGLTIKQSGPVVKNRLSALSPDAQVWAFQAKPGEHSPVIETSSEYIVARVDSTREGGIPRLDAIRSEVEALVRNGKKQAEARKVAEEVRTRATAPGGSLESAAKSLNLPFNTLGPVARVNAPLNGGQAIGRAFSLQPAEISGPVDGKGMIYVMQGMERIPADSAEFVKELPALRQRALDNMRQLHLRQYLAALRTNAKIRDNRDQIYKTAAQVEAEAPVVPGTRQ
jgi:peptidyl-prolyl cis-trans isomerase D